MSRRSDDGSEAFVGCIAAIIGLLFSAVIALAFGAYNKHQNTVRMPDVLEPDPNYKPPRTLPRFIPWLLGLVGIGLIVGGWIGYGANVQYNTTAGAESAIMFGFPVIGLAVLLQVSVLEKDRRLKLLKEQEPPPSITPTARRYVITLPRNTPWQPEVAWRLVEHLVKNVPHIIFCVVAEPNRITWQIIDWRTGVAPEVISQAVHTYYPTAEVTWQGVKGPKRSFPFYRYTLHFQQATEFVWPIKPVGDLKDFDPLAALTQALTDLQPGERIVYTLALSIPAHYAYQEGEKLITQSRIHPLQFFSALGKELALAAVLTGQGREDKYVHADQKVARSKLNNPLSQCFLSIEIDSPKKERVEQLLNLDTQVWQFEFSPYNALVWCPDPLPDSIKRIEDAKSMAATGTLASLKSWVLGQNDDWKRCKLILSPQEIASLWHLPHEKFNAPGIQWSRGRRVPAPPAVVENQAGVLLGHNAYGARQTPIRLPHEDRQGHVYIIGKTGMGKSTLMHQMIHQDIADGKGVGVIDPHGKLVRDILRQSIPPDREDDVVVVDLAQTEYPAPLNPFALPSDVAREAALSHVIGLLKKIYADAWSPTRMESALYSAVVALLDDPEATPRDISRLFLDSTYRRRLLHQVTDPVALEYWYEEFEPSSPGSQTQTREPILHRLRIFYRNRAVRNMVCHPHRLDFRQIMDERKIFLASLASEKTQSEQANLGAMLMANFQMAAMSRQPDTRLDNVFYLFVDEVQQFVTSSLPVVFSGARKFGLSLTAANQFLGQLRGETLEAIMGNAGAFLMFGCGPDDARALTPFVRPEFTTDDLVNFDRFHMAARMQIHGQTVPAFSLHTEPPRPEPEDGLEREERIRRKSIANYTPWSQAEVEAWLNTRYPPRPRVDVVSGVTDYD